MTPNYQFVGPLIDRLVERANQLADRIDAALEASSNPAELEDEFNSICRQLDLLCGKDFKTDHVRCPQWASPASEPSPI
jgi:hypothetical protein